MKTLQRFEKSEYTAKHALDAADKAPTPLWRDTELDTLVMWGGNTNPIPNKGEVITMRVPIPFVGVVDSYHYSYGYIGIKVRPATEYLEALSESGYGKLKADYDEDPNTMLVWNYGNDVLEGMVSCDTPIQ